MKDLPTVWQPPPTRGRRKSHTVRRHLFELTSAQYMHASVAMDVPHQQKPIYTVYVPLTGAVPVAEGGNEMVVVVFPMAGCASVAVFT
ncbi:MAG: hypothetical protein UY72_C0075G0004 [Candidatus Uhrbacteria bacterium GW2011_GWD2_52_7]|uniref:Uncharacterized protein n=1 Tax=Candidatus Uhrbacteria bacterium GW2011_GWD2_52_7 TaxID=1618989 RepID=A0A0G1XBT9_9BACT|nr:MAG: hypothetical protein UY72_C0075G0004 [Candidatus Uhrbacteria bacterium GW2011_GWD2_52_7]